MNILVLEKRSKLEFRLGLRVEDQIVIHVLQELRTERHCLFSEWYQADDHIVGVSSLAGFGGLPKTAGYSASKAAVTKFLESIRLDLRGRGVDVTIVSPGYVRTPMTARNEYPMPYLVELDDAVALIRRAISKRQRALMFPWPLAAPVWVGQILPRRLYDWLGSRVPRKKAR